MVDSPSAKTRTPARPEGASAWPENPGQTRPHHPCVQTSELGHICLRSLQPLLPFSSTSRSPRTIGVIVFGRHPSVVALHRGTTSPAKHPETKSARKDQLSLVYSPSSTTHDVDPTCECCGRRVFRAICSAGCVLTEWFPFSGSLWLKRAMLDAYRIGIACRKLWRCPLDKCAERRPKALVHSGVRRSHQKLGICPRINWHLCSDGYTLPLVCAVLLRLRAEDVDSGPGVTLR